jgi:hypothetical protein
MPTFSIKDLLIATAMVCVGLTMAVLACTPRLLVDDELHLLCLRVLLYMAGCGLVGAGCLYPYGRRSFGLRFGVLVGWVAGILLGWV